MSYLSQRSFTSFSVNPKYLVIGFDFNIVYSSKLFSAVSDYTVPLINDNDKGNMCNFVSPLSIQSIYIYLLYFSVTALSINSESIE